MFDSKRLLLIEIKKMIKHFQKNFILSHFHAFHPFSI